MRKEKDVKTEEPETEQLDELVILFQFEDFTILRNVSKNTIIIDKQSGGISDSCYARVATGQDKNWSLYDQNGILINTEVTHGNRPFHYEGTLLPGTYTLKTGKGNDITIRRIPGRHFNIIFTV